MKALSRLPPNEGIAAMQSINVVAVNSLFLAVFLRTALACVRIIISALVWWRYPSAVWLVAGGGLYVVSTFLVTAVRNVPLNDALAEIALSSPESAQRWTSYLKNGSSGITAGQVQRLQPRHGRRSCSVWDESSRSTDRVGRSASGITASDSGAGATMGRVEAIDQQVEMTMGQAMV